MQLNRRYIRGLQFAVAYTLAKTVSDGTTYNPLRPGAGVERGSRRARPSSTTSSSATPGTCRKGAGCGTTSLTRGLLDGWQLSGDTALVSGDWSGASTSTTDNVDFTGGDGGTRPRISGETVCTSGNCDPAPGGTGSFLNAAAFSRLTGRGDIGNAPRTFFQLPGIVNTNMSAFKNFAIGGNKRIQLRWEVYNLLQPGELVRDQHQRAVQPAGAAGQPELRPGDRRPQREGHAGGDPIQFLRYRIWSA